MRFSIIVITSYSIHYTKLYEEKSEIGYLAPGFNLRNLQGNRDSLANYEGQVVVINFWATWCGPCRVEMPSFEALYRRYRSQGLTVIAVSLDKGADAKVRQFAQERGLSFPVLMDTDGEAERLYPVITSYSIHYTKLYDPLRVRFLHHGGAR